MVQKVTLEHPELATEREKAIESLRKFAQNKWFRKGLRGKMRQTIFYSGVLGAPEEPYWSTFSHRRGNNSTPNLLPREITKIRLMFVVFFSKRRERLSERGVTH